MQTIEDSFHMIFTDIANIFIGWSKTTLDQDLNKKSLGDSDFYKFPK